MTMLTPEELESLENILAAHEDLDALGRLPAGWNGYGAKPINPAILAAANKFLDDIPATTVFPRPQVVPMTKGRLQLEWNSPDDKRSLEIEFASPNHVCYLQVDEHEESEVQELVSLTEPGRLYDLIRWFADATRKDGPT